MKVIITESQHKKLTEQISGMLAGRAIPSPRISLDLAKGPKTGNSARLPFPEDSPVDDIPCEYFPNERVEQLFKRAMNWSSAPQDWEKVKPIAEKMKNELTGLGSGNFVNLLKLIDTKEKLSALVKNWKYNNESLYQWMNDDLFVIKNSIPVLSKHFDLPVCRPGCKCPYT